jgi:aldehyde:ferredoxin oxidoreductase
MGQGLGGRPGQPEGGDGQKRARVLQCGIAEENLVLFANIVNELKHFNGRCGLGAVMGSKRLKAIAVRGKGKLEPKNPAALGALAKWFRETYDRNADMVHKFGTPRNVLGLNKDGILPTHNFQHGQFEHAQEISGEQLRDTILVDEGTCFACAVACKRDVEVPEFGVTSRYGGSEYERISSSGSVCDIGDLKAIIKFHQHGGEYVTDTISVGTTIGFAMECYDKGLLTTADTDVLELKFGNAEALLALMEKIGMREGVGHPPGPGAEARCGALRSHPEELGGPIHEPRERQELSPVYSTAPAEADTCAPRRTWSTRRSTPSGSTRWNLFDRATRETA